MTTVTIVEISAFQMTVLGVLDDGPLTDEQIYDKLRASGVYTSQTGARSRRAELVTLGLLEHNGKFSTTKAGYQARQWEQTKTWSR